MAKSVRTSGGMANPDHAGSCITKEGGAVLDDAVQDGHRPACDSTSQCDPYQRV